MKVSIVLRDNNKKLLVFPIQSSKSIKTKQKTKRNEKKKQEQPNRKNTTNISHFLSWSAFSTQETTKEEEDDGKY
jgi:hypothetical protein